MNDRREKIRHGMQTVAKIIARDGETFLPIFERLEREYLQLTAAESALERARRMAGDL